MPLVKQNRASEFVYVGQRDGSDSGGLGSVVDVSSSGPTLIKACQKFA